jgi:tetratricopeptide (TPR) repeat protein
MSVPESFVTLYTEKNKFDMYNSRLPVVTRDVFAGKPFQDANKAALKTRTFFGEPRFTFTPVVIEAERNLYLAAARNALNTYAELFVEKMRLIRGGVKPQTSVAQKPVDTTGIKQVNEEARKNNETTPQTTGELTDAVQRAERAGKFQLAVDYYGELIKLNPDDAQYYVNRGVLYLNELKNFKAAAADFTKAVELKAANPLVIYNRGTAFLFMNDWKKAIRDFDAFVAVQPDFVNAYLNRGLALLNVKKIDEALADFNYGLKLAPRLPNLYRARALAFKIKGDNAQAQADELRAAQIERGQ